MMEGGAILEKIISAGAVRYRYLIWTNWICQYERGDCLEKVKINRRCGK
jgi:hypothetical protein